MWPEQAPDQIDILTTLYRSQHDDQYDDKVTFLVFVFMSRSPTTKINKTLWKRLTGATERTKRVLVDIFDGVFMSLGSD